MFILDAFGSNASFHHVGIAVSSIQEAAPTCESVYDPRQDVAVGFIELNGLPVELIEPGSVGSPVSRSLSSGRRLQHLCYEVDDLEMALAQGRGWGFHRIAPPVPATAFGGRQIVWVFSARFGLFELLERE